MARRLVKHRDFTFTYPLQDNTSLLFRSENCTVLYCTVLYCTVFSWLRIGYRGALSKHDNERSGFIKSGEFLEQLSDYQLLKRDCASWSEWVSFIDFFGLWISRDIKISQSYLVVSLGFLAHSKQNTPQAGASSTTRLGPQTKSCVLCYD
jgi:hypothetical protein